MRFIAHITWGFFLHTKFEVAARDDGTTLLQTDSTEVVLAQGWPCPGEETASSFAKLAVKSKAPNGAEDQRGSGHEQGEVAPEGVLMLVGSSKTEGSHNLCMNGSIAPQFFLLGAQKAATTTFANVIHDRSSALNDGNEKENHIFEQDCRFYAGQSYWLSQYPQCRRDVRIVGTDSTPNYLASDEAPSRIAMRYGSQASALQFMVLLREPAKRMQSAYYHCKDPDRAWDCNEVPPSFRDFVDALIDPSVGEVLGGFLLQASEYAPQLERYFNTFSPSQFVIAGMKFTYKLEPHNIYTWISNKLGIDSFSVTSIPYSNSYDHQSIEEDLGPDLFARLNTFLEEKGGAHAVANVLASHPHADLFGYEGSRNSADSIAEWLTDYW